MNRIWMQDGDVARRSELILTRGSVRYGRQFRSALENLRVILATTETPAQNMTRVKTTSAWALKWHASAVRTTRAIRWPDVQSRTGGRSRLRRRQFMNRKWHLSKWCLHEWHIEGLHVEAIVFRSFVLCQYRLRSHDSELHAQGSIQKTSEAALNVYQTLTWIGLSC
jgi:hypothetical protein